METTPRALFAVLAVTLAGCAVDRRELPPADPGGDAAVAPGADSGAGPTRDGGAGGADAAADGPRIYFYVRTSTAPFPHADGLSGQTARHAYQGIRSFTLMRDADDREPVTVLDLGDSNVEAGYNDGDETLVGSAPLASVRPGRYTVGKNVVTHSRYEVDATMHVGGLVVPGVLDNVQVLTDGTPIDGVPRPSSWFRYVFRAAGMAYPIEGLGAPLPTEPTTGGFRLVIEGGEAVYYYPIDVTIDEAGDADVRVVLDVNMDHSFRWEDQALPGYAPGVFDSTSVVSEPVRRFGANSLAVTVE